MRISDWSSDVCSSDLPDRLASWVATRGEGERNRGLFWASCRMAESGQRFDVAATVLGEAAQSAGLTEREAMTTIRSAYRIDNRLGPPSAAGSGRGPSRTAEGVRLCPSPPPLPPHPLA